MNLRSSVDRVVFDSAPSSDVFGVRLVDGREVVVKRRIAELGRTRRCLEIQAAVAAAGYPCAAPLTDAIDLDGQVVHAEQWRPGGHVRHDEGLAHAAASAQVLADLMRLTIPLSEHPRVLLPNPVWVRWGHSGGAWPRFELVDQQQARTGISLPSWLERLQERLRARLTRTSLPLVIGHGDWEAQNLRWEGHKIHTVHDWDSLAALPEAAVVGAAAGAFASTDVPTLAPLDSSDHFLAVYQEAADRHFTPEEVEVAWAASMYTAAHNARGEILFATTPTAGQALRSQAAERLRRASA